MPVGRFRVADIPDVALLRGRRSRLSMSALRSRRVFLVLVILLWWQSAFALNSARTIFQLKHTAWTAENGAPVGILSIAQTSDGYLWLGTGAGLVRFDGVKFEPFDTISDARLLNYDIYGLWAAPSGGLWIGYATGGATLFKDGHSTNFGETEGIGRSSVSAFAEDGAGNLWAGTGGGMWRFDGARWHIAGSEEKYSFGPVNRLHLDAKGTLWVQGDNSLALLKRHSSAFEDTGIHAENPMIAEAPDGTIYEADVDSGVRRLHESLSGVALPEPPIIDVKSSLPNVDRDGAIWIATDSGIFHYGRPQQLQPSSLQSSPVEHYDTKDGLSGNFVAVYFEDREGNIWLGTDGGLDRFRDAKVVRVPTPPRRAYFAIAPAASGGLWVGSQNVPGLLKVTGNQVEDQHWPGQVSCAFTDADGGVWIGGTTGFWRLEGGHWTAIAKPPIWKTGAAAADVQAMARDGSGALWASFVNHGLYQWSNGVWTRNGGLPDFLKKGVVSETTDPHGRVWFGYQGNAMAILDGATLTNLNAADGLDVGTVLSFDTHGKHSWIGGEGGLARFDGKRFNTVLVTGLESAKQISGIVETPKGDLWLNGSVGIVHIDSAELDRNAADPKYPVQAEIFNAADGLPGKANALRPLPSAVQGSDGRIWFATDFALSWLDPTAIHRNPMIPAVWVQGIETNGQRQPLTSRPDLPARTRNLQINYTALSLSIPERVRFRYKLEGFDDGWQNAAGRRVAYYTNLAPGNYRFSVIAANDDGVWNNAGDAMEFSIRPTFFQTRLFLAVCVAAAILILWILHRFRLRQLVANASIRLEERLTERERISRDLHDTLLQNMQGLIYRFQAAANRLPKLDPVRSILESELNHADEMIGESRGILTGLRGITPGTVELADALIAHGEHLANEGSIKLKTVVQGRPRSLHPVVFEEALHIGREALANAFHHSKATQIELEIVYEHREFSLRVRDDGVGIDPSTQLSGNRPGHFGLIGMRERSNKIRARIDIWSRPGAGTEIALRIPSAMAYRARNRTWQ
jgi:signal transduction histidine kinase/ligand-binding sensor domain-containing protein